MHEFDKKDAARRLRETADALDPVTAGLPTQANPMLVALLLGQIEQYGPNTVAIALVEALRELK